MEIDVTELKRMIVEKNTTLDAVARILDINRSTLYRKLRGDARGVTVKEAQSIALYLGLNTDEVLNIFWKTHGADMHQRTSRM